ncbi:sulfite exporter TauE/SafE family protein [Cyanobium sp. AMD-g]|uniref:sulfite exporter TauE/SafE family protein n=1 Tax=Cyanobium sp. AMD-g TaxID=2823699 RepID=UPI0020CC33D7|nr:sulfite exporter TauE/SafE family protein [Cyanobium sp. AMD-g]MCP9929878.1 sulfite exporter TauE/SafE family protein [Cyanobium sp. AMD-g]
MATPLIWSLLPLLPLGLVAGLLSGLLGIGGGLIFSPLLLLLGLTPHQALATSTLAIVPTTLGGTIAHGRSGKLTWSGGVAIAGGAALSAGLFSHLGQGLAGWQLLSLQAALYALLTGLVKPRSQLAPVREREPHPLALALVGALAGVAAGLLGVGGGLVMVPVMVAGLGMPVHGAIRYSTVAVLASSCSASLAFLADGRANPLVALVLGGTAAVAAQWSASRLERVREERLVWMLRAITLVLAVDSGRRAVGLWFEAQGITLQKPGSSS